jgi:hypothetical protein
MGPDESSSGDRARHTAMVAEKVLAHAEELCRGDHYLQAFEMLDDVADRADFSLGSTYGPRFQSFYGLSVAMTFGQISRGERLCREALEVGGFEADLAYNLALIYLRCRRRDLAFQTFRDILRVDPRHADTLASMKRLGVRTAPVFPFLPRSHPLNKYTGKVIYRARQYLQGRQHADAAA